MTRRERLAKTVVHAGAIAAGVAAGAAIATLASPVLAFGAVAYGLTCGACGIISGYYLDKAETSVTRKYGLG